MRCILGAGQPYLRYLDVINPVTIFDTAAMILYGISFLEKTVALVGAIRR